MSSQRLAMSAGAMALGLCCLLSPAHAEEAEFVAGTAAGAMFPAFSSPEPTDFALAAWSTGAFGHVGLNRNLSLGVGFDFARFSGEASEQKLRDGAGEALTANVRFHGQLYHSQLFARYKLYRGYDLAPYVQASVGYLWAQYFDPVAVSNVGEQYVVDLQSFAAGSGTVSLSFAADLRLFHAFMVGVGVGYTRMLSGTLKQALHIPITLAIYW